MCQKSNQIPDSEIVYRAINKKSWIENQQITQEAFFLKPNENGLSVSLNSEGCPEACTRNLKKTYGIVSASVGDLRSFGLDVIPDPPPPHHALIIHLPYRDDDPATAEHFATLLAETFQIYDSTVRVNPKL